MWWWTYVFHLKDCGISAHGIESGVLPHDSHYPMGFQWGDAAPLLGEAFIPWRDSVLAALEDDQTLLVTGVAYRDEVSSLDVLHLARARARAISRLFEEELSRHQLQLNARVGVVQSDIKRKVFQGFQLRTLTQNQAVRQTEACTLIFVPADSTVQGYAPEVEHFLTNLVAELHGTAFLTLCTSATVPVTDTVRIQQEKFRLDRVKKSLISYGYPDDRILIRPEGSPGDDCASDPVQEVQNWIMLKEN